MKSKETTVKRSQVLRFWLVMLLCTAMIGAACLFAYTQTQHDLQVQLDTTISSIQPATNPPYTKPVRIPMTTPVTTEIVTVPRTEARTLEASEPVNRDETQTECVTQPSTGSSMRFCMPVAGDIIQPFSNGALVRSETTGVWQTHNGVDLSAALGDPVMAAGTGIVSQICDDPLWGITITIDHKNGYITRYCNLGADLSVTEGDTVECGFVIGAVGKTADAESVGETHLHFEVLKDGAHIDPEQLPVQ